DCPRPPLGPGARREGGRSRPHRKRTWISSPSSRRSRAAIECLPPAYFAISQGLRTLFRDILKRLPGPGEPGSVSGQSFVSLDDDVAIAGSYSISRARRPDLWAAIRVVPEPPNGSSTRSPRRLQSLIASATSATGLTVGCKTSSSRRPARKLFTPG